MSEERVVVITPELQGKIRQMLGRIRNEFQEDLLFNLLVERNQEDMALNDSIGTLEPGKTYSTSDLAELLDLKSDSNIRNIIRPLKKYIKPDESTGSYRLDYKACFRIQMIIILKDEYKLPALAKMLVGGSSNNQSVMVQDNLIPDTKIQDMMSQIQTQQKQIETLSSILHQLYETKLFRVDGIGENAKVILNDQYISELITKTTASLIEDTSQEEVKELLLNQEQLIKKMEEEQKNKNMDTEQLKQEISILSSKVEELTTKNKRGFLARLFGG